MAHRALRGIQTYMQQDARQSQQNEPDRPAFPPIGPRGKWKSFASIVDDNRRGPVLKELLALSAAA
jgi:hypothetical protein